MTTIRRSSPIYIVRSDSEDGVYDAIPCPSEDRLGGQLANRLLGQLVRGIPGSKDVAERIESPATGYTPGFPQTPPADCQGSTGFGPAADSMTQRPSLGRRLQRRPYGVFLGEEAPGEDVIGILHLPRRAFVKAGLYLLLLLAVLFFFAGLGAGLIALLL